MAVIGREGGKFRIPIILHDNYFLYGKIVPPPKKLNIPWDQLTENYGSMRTMKKQFFVLLAFLSRSLCKRCVGTCC